MNDFSVVVFFIYLVNIKWFLILFNLRCCIVDICMVLSGDLIIMGRLYIDSLSVDVEIYLVGGIIWEKYYVFWGRVWFWYLKIF